MISLGDAKDKYSEHKKKELFQYYFFFLFRIRYFDAIILLPNLVFLFFLLIKWYHTRAKLNSTKPLLFTVCCLILTVSFVNILRCFYAMIFGDERSTVKIVILKVNIKRKIELFCTSLLFRYFGYSFDLHFYVQK